MIGGCIYLSFFFFTLWHKNVLQNRAVIPKPPIWGIKIKMTILLALTLIDFIQSMF